MNNPVVILIISHKPDLTYYEEISLRQCFKVLGHYPTKLLLPSGCDPEHYLSIHHKLKVEYVNPDLLSGLREYNQYRLQPDLYIDNLKYKYILFYELDSFVFKDELLNWCQSGYDYLGAPWFEKFHKASHDANFIHGCNGGFSLRNVKKMLIGNYITSVFRRSNRKLKLQEDTYWVNNIAPYFPGFRIAPSDIAMKFAFENLPSRLYKLNNKELPFGAHAWCKYDLDFWKPAIEAEGYELP